MHAGMGDDDDAMSIIRSTDLDNHQLAQKKNNCDEFSVFALYKTVYLRHNDPSDPFLFLSFFLLWHDQIPTPFYSCVPT
jgi:hypothetical protein